MIEDLDGRLVSRRTREEEIELLRRDFAQLTEPEQNALRALLRELDDPAFMDVEQANDVGGPVRILDAMKDAEYLREPVSLRKFIFDPYYLGETCADFYQELVPDMEALFAGNYSEVILTGSIGWGKCLESLTEVYNTRTGRREVVSEISELGITSMVDGGRLEDRPATCFPSGRKRCVALSLADGKRLTLSNDHPVFTARGWIEASKLLADDLVATPRFMPDSETSPDVSDDLVKLVAYLMADGGCTGPATFTNETSVILDEFRGLVGKLGDSSQYDKYHRHIVPGTKEIKEGNSGNATMLRASGIRHIVSAYGCDKKATEKRLPAEFYGLSRDQVSLFLNRFWACDGSIYTKSPRKIEIGLGSEKLIDDIAFLLLRFGIHARKSYKRKSCKHKGETKWFDSWHLAIASSEGILRFLDCVGPIFGKESACADIRVACEGVQANTNTDVVPVGLPELLEIRKELGKRGVGLTSRFGCPKGQLFGRQRFARLCDEFEYKGKYAWLATSDIAWERIAEITDAGVCDVWDLTVPGTHNLVANNIVVHNTFFASIALCRMLYEISCLRNPHRSFGIAAKTNLAIVALSISESLAIKVIFENIATKISASPYFQEYYPYEETKKEMRFPNNVWVAARASTDNSALGLNVFGAIIDEGNFMAPAKRGRSGIRFGKKDQAELLYDKLKRRMKSRFQRHGRLPGMMIVVSSKNTKDDFTRKLVEDRKDDPDVFVRDYALWDVKSDRYSKELFQVLVGNENVTSKVLSAKELEEVKDHLQEGMHILDVPVDFKPDFENDVDGSIRDIAGVETVSVSPFIQQRDRIALCTDNVNFPARKHPFDVVEWDQSKPGGFRWSRFAHEVEIRDGGESFMAWQPKFYPGHTRHVHIDPSLNSDATGFAVGCVIGYTEVRRRDRENYTEIYTESAPVIWIDFMLRIVPPVGGEINYGKIRGLVYQLQAHGFPIGLATMDHWNSADTMQKFTVKGIETERVSLDRTMDPYDTTKAAIYEGRCHMYQYEPAREELQALQRDNIKNKVDHPVKGSKDVADAIAGVVFSLTTNYRGGPLDIVKGISSYGQMTLDEQRVMVERDQTGSEDEVMLPFIQG